MEVERRGAGRVEHAAHEAEQCGLALVGRLEPARERDLVETETGLASGALERLEPVLAALVLGERERDALLGASGSSPWRSSERKRA